MKNLNFRQDWHIIISQESTDVQIEIYNTDGVFPDDLSEKAQEVIYLNFASLQLAKV